MMNRFLYLLMYAWLAALVTACDDDAHEGEYPLSEGQGALFVGLDVPDGFGVDDLTLYLFGSDGTAALCRTYNDPRSLALEYLPIEAGNYTPVVVANTAPSTKSEALPQATTLPDLAEWLKELQGNKRSLDLFDFSKSKESPFSIVKGTEQPRKSIFKGVLGKKDYALFDRELNSAKSQSGKDEQKFMDRFYGATSELVDKQFNI